MEEQHYVTTFGPQRSTNVASVFPTQTDQYRSGIPPPHFEVLSKFCVPVKFGK